MAYHIFMFNKFQIRQCVKVSDDINVKLGYLEALRHMKCVPMYALLIIIGLLSGYLSKSMNK